MSRREAERLEVRSCRADLHDMQDYKLLCCECNIGAYVRGKALETTGKQLRLLPTMTIIYWLKQNRADLST